MVTDQSNVKRSRTMGILLQKIMKGGESDGKEERIMSSFATEK